MNFCISIQEMSMTNLECHQATLTQDISELRVSGGKFRDFMVELGFGVKGISFGPHT